MRCLWPPGASTLDPEMCGRYKLSVMVKDMAGKVNAFFTTGIVIVEVTGNTWASPDPVRLQENLPGPYPIPISQVQLIITHSLGNFQAFQVTLKSLLLIWFSLWIVQTTRGKCWTYSAFPRVNYHITVKQTRSIARAESCGITLPVAVFRASWVVLSDQILNYWCCSNAMDPFRLPPDWVTLTPIITHTYTHQPPPALLQYHHYYYLPEGYYTNL